MALRATFAGKSPFPMEMLLEDECFPWTNQDVTNIVELLRNPYSGVELTVTLCKVNARPWGVDRWKMKGWKLIKLHFS